MSNTLIDLSPNLLVKNVNETMDFYIQKLGFQQVATVPENGQFIWGMVKSGSITIMFQEEQSIKEEYPVLNNFTGGPSLTFYIHVNGLQELYDELMNKNVNIISGMQRKPYGADEFSIADCNGYVLTFSERS